MHNMPLRIHENHTYTRSKSCAILYCMRYISMHDTSNIESTLELTFPMWSFAVIAMFTLNYVEPV